MFATEAKAFLLQVHLGALWVYGRYWSVNQLGEKTSFRQSCSSEIRQIWWLFGFFYVHVNNASGCLNNQGMATIREWKVVTFAESFSLENSCLILL